MTREESLAATWQVLGSSRAERRNNVRTMVSTIYRGGNVLTAVEEPIEGRWKAGLDNGRYTREQGLLWVRLAEKATGQKFLSATDAEVLGSADKAPRSLTEAISAVVTADVLGRRRDGTRLPAGLVTQGVMAAVRQAAGVKERGEVVRLGQFLRAWRALFGQVFSRARALNKARAEGRLGEDYEGFLDDLMGADGSGSAPNSAIGNAGRTESITELPDGQTTPLTLKPGETLWEENGVTFGVAPVPFADNVEAAVKGRLPANAILDMGRPGEVLRKAGVPDLPMWIRLSKVRKKRGKHSELTAEVLKKFPAAMDSPMLVYVSPGDRKAHSIVTSIATSQGPLTAYFTVHEREGQNVLEAKTLFGKEPGELLAEIHEAEALGLITHKNKGAFDAWLAEGDGTLDGTSTQHGPAIEGLKEVFHEADGSQPSAHAHSDNVNSSLQTQEIFQVDEEAADPGAEFNDNWGEISFSLGPQEPGAPSPMRDASGKINVEGWRVTKLKGALATYDSQFKDLIDDRERADAIYRKIPETKGGKVLGTDLSRMIDENYRTSREWRIDNGKATVHAAAVDAADRLFRELASPNGRTKILFTAGGVGAGKSTVVDDAMIADYDLVFDGTLRNTAEAIQSIEYALDHGWTVHIQYVQRPLELALNGVIHRADELGRWGPINDVPQAHLDAQKSLIAIAGRFAGNPRVKIEYWHNTSESRSAKPEEIEPNQIHPGGSLSFDNDAFARNSQSKVEQAFRDAVRNRGKVGEPGNPSAGDARRYDPVVLERMARPSLELQAIFWREVLSGTNPDLEPLNEQQRIEWAVQEARKILRLPGGTSMKAVTSRLDNDTGKRWKEWLKGLSAVPPH